MEFITLKKGSLFSLESKMIDTHAHLDFPDFDFDREVLLKKCSEQNIKIINPGTNFETSSSAVNLAKKFSNIYAGVGLHPQNIKSEFLKFDSLEKKELKFDYFAYKKLAQTEKVVAIGEAGLDFWNQPKSKEKRLLIAEEQTKIFIQQLDLAKELNLPIIIHCRQAFNQLILILKNNQNQGVVHCFTGNWEQAKELLDLGFYLGVNGIIFKLDLTETIKKCPLDRILLETDCPFLSPPGFEQRNSPLSLPIIANKIASLKGISKEQVLASCFDNARKLFKI